jgi:hypothetical protein
LSAPFQTEGCSHRSPVNQTKEINVNETRIWLIHVPCFSEFLFEWDCAHLKKPKETRNNTKARIRRRTSCCEKIMKKRNDKTNGIKTGNKQKGK